MDPHAQPIDPNNASANPHLQCKQCTDCRAILPIAHFGKAKINRDGYSKICKDCRAQYLRIKRVEKYGCKSTQDDSIVRNFRHHNTAILNKSLNSTLEVRGFDVISKVDYKVFFGPSKYTGMQSIALFDFNCQLYREFTYCGKTGEVMETVLDILRNLNIRLEYTDGDVVTSKSTIYYV